MSTNMSSQAMEMQRQVLQHPELLQQYMTAYRENKMSPDQAEAWRQLLAAAQSHQGRPGVQAMGNSAQQPNQMPAQQPFHAPSPVPSSGQPQQRQQSNPGAALSVLAQQLPVPVQLVEQFAKARLQIGHLEAYLRREDLGQDHRQSAQAKLDESRRTMSQLGGQINQAAGQEPQKLAVIQEYVKAYSATVSRTQAAPAPNGSAPDPNAFAAQQARVMQQRQQALAQQQRPGSAQQPPQRAGTPASMANQPQMTSQGSSSHQNAVNPNHTLGPLPPIADDVASHLTPARAETFAKSTRPTLNQGLAAQTMLGSPAITRPPNSHAQTGLGGALGEAAALGLGGIGGPDPYAGRTVNKRKLAELAATVDPYLRFEPDVEELLLEAADEFIESVTKFSCRLAQHRKSDRLECKDVQLHLEHTWNMRLPGFFDDTVRQSQNRRLNIPPSHLNRLAVARDPTRRRAGQ